MSVNTRRALHLVAACALCLAVATPAVQAQERLALGFDGTVYRLLDGAYGGLFPDGALAYPESPVLALDVARADGTSERWLVPGTESRDAETAASIVFEKRTEKVYVLHETLINDLHPLLRLSSFDGVEWSGVIQIANGPFSRKGSPQMVVTREPGSLRGRAEERTILHLTWWEEGPEVSRKRYAPVILEDGAYLGWSPVIDLGKYFLEAEEDPFPVPGLETALALRRGANDRAVVLGYVHPLTHRLVTLRVEALSRLLSLMADKARAHIVIVGLKTESRAELAQSVRSALLEEGSLFHQAALNFMADEVARIVESAEEEMTPEGLLSIADKARAHIVIVGSRIGPRGLQDSNGSQILDIGRTSGGGGPYHHLKVSVVSDRPAPEVGGPAELLVSETGRNVIVVWEDGDGIHYRESVGDGWSEPSVIELSEQLDRETAYRMLEERVRTD